MTSSPLPIEVVRARKKASIEAFRLKHPMATRTAAQTATLGRMYDEWEGTLVELAAQRGSMKVIGKFNYIPEA